MTDKITKRRKRKQPVIVKKKGKTRLNKRRRIKQMKPVVRIGRIPVPPAQQAEKDKQLRESLTERGIALPGIYGYLAPGEKGV